MLLVEAAAMKETREQWKWKRRMTAAGECYMGVQTMTRG